MVFESKNKWMFLAIEEAIKAKKFKEVPIGAVLINSKKNILLAKSGNNIIRKSNPLAHAEIEVINLALKKLKKNFLFNTALYVTLEPCLMCTAAISEVRIPKVYFGAYDKKNRSIEKGPNTYLKKSYFIPDFYGGISEETCSTIISDYFKNIRKKTN
tara:strand:+ start:4445 stop:4915 length:471 start_codon:yes stop_codon:yes gene_type:complete